MKKILITGDQGYIGAVIAPLLLNRGYSIVGYDTNYFTDGLPFIPNKIPRYKKIYKDIRNIEKKDLRGVDIVIHLAALSNDPIGELNPSKTYEINFKTSVKLAKLCIETGVKRFIFSSSCSVYGSREELPVTEGDSLVPLTPYAKSKVKTEKALMKMANNNFSPIILRNPTVYGYSPKMRLDLVVNNLVAWALTTGKINLLSDGRAWRPLIHIKDLARVFTLMIEAKKSLIHNQIFNVGTDKENYLISDIAKEIHRQLPNCRITFAKKATTDKRSYRINFQKFKQFFPDFKFKMTLSKGIKELKKVLEKNKLTLEEFEGRKFIRLRAIKYLLETGQIDNKLYWIRKEFCGIH